MAADGRWHPPRRPPTGDGQPAAAPATATLSPLDPDPPAAHRVPDLPADFASAPRGAAPGRPRGRRPGQGARVRLLLAAGAVVVLGAAALVVTLARGSGNGLTGDTPRQVVALATAAARRTGSVRLVVRIQGPGQSATYVDHVGVADGSQTVTSSSGAQLSSLVVGGTAYVRANQAALTSLLQSPPALARQVAGRWFSVPSGDPDEATVARNVTLGSVIASVTPGRPASTLLHRTVDGTAVVGVRGELPGGLEATLYVPTTGAPLPVEETSSYQGSTTTAVFSAWGTPVEVAAPSGATPAASVPALFGDDAGTEDQAAANRAAQSNLTNALTEAAALYQDGQSYAPGGAALTTAAFSSAAPEFDWTGGACDAASPQGCVSLQVVDAARRGDGQGVVLAVYSPGTGDCWYGLDLEAPAHRFTDAAPDVALVAPGRTPGGAPTPGVYFAHEPPGATVAASTSCSAAWAVTRPAFGWGPSYSNPGTAG